MHLQLFETGIGLITNEYKMYSQNVHKIVNTKTKVT